MARGRDNKNKKLHLVGQFYDYILVLMSDPVRYGQVRSGTVIRQTLYSPINYTACILGE